MAVDLLDEHAALLHSSPTRGEPGASDALFREYSDRLEAMLEVPRPDAGAAGNVAGAFRFCSEVEGLLGEASRVCGAAPRRRQGWGAARRLPVRRFYLRVDEWGNDDLQRKLAGHGLRVIFEPYGAFFELLQLRQIQDGVALKKRPARRRKRRWRRCATSSAG